MDDGLMTKINPEYRDRLVVLGDNSPYVRERIAEMSNVVGQMDAYRFRENAKLVGMMLAYEAERRHGSEMGLEERSTETVLGTRDSLLRRVEPRIFNILRAANPMVEGTLEIFRQAPVTFMDAKRVEGTADAATGRINVNLTYCTSLPKGRSLEGKWLMNPDIMLASGSSLVTANEYLGNEYGTPAGVIVSAALATPEGVNRVLGEIPNSYVYLGVLDPELVRDILFIKPGLGDAGDSAYDGGVNSLDIVDALVHANDVQVYQQLREEVAREWGNSPKRFDQMINLLKG